MLPKVCRTSGLDPAQTHADDGCAATLDVKLKAPNGTNVTVKGKQSFDGVTTGSVRCPDTPGILQSAVLAKHEPSRSRASTLSSLRVREIPPNQNPRADPPMAS